MDNLINIFEMSPRDGLQNEKNFISTNDKIKFINKLSFCGFKKIETSSFVSPKWVPQLSDARDVFRGISRMKGVKYTALTPNEKGFDNAVIAKVDEVAIFTAASETFNKKNTNCDIQTSLRRFKPIMNKAKKNKLPVRGYISCVSHCPYENYVDPKKVALIANELIKMGCYEVSLGDTTGKGNAEQTFKVIKECLHFTSPKNLAGHFHDTYQNALDNIKVCLENGMRTFDSSVGGLGGCPYSPGAKGNIATEKVNKLVLSMGYKTNLDSSKINECGDIAKKLKTTGSYS
ncbi:hydroxymethylglutaryl-CoA lyase [Alphaproteobacteria bacterium]|jgi:hydroxymethylglutaryl-CoA lyase|nr:hydroxymethylglutaryl-CoA lyase [Alphaproteobacteria bacterium]MDC1085775.1 hydroxymethylglutaryl-CoA lyase [Alphaproteobacteria bacterium]MDC6452164.1 hydroxymethylglutaryl-CoA lyase [Alphaproteobacteria bacterium]